MRQQEYRCKRRPGESEGVECPRQLSNTLRRCVTICQRTQGSAYSHCWCLLRLYTQVNQHPGPEQANDLDNLKTAIGASVGTLVILDKEGGPLMRVWCL